MTKANLAEGTWGSELATSALIQKPPKCGICSWGGKGEDLDLLCCIFNLILFNFGFSLCLIKCEYNDICAEFLSSVIMQLGCDMLIF